MGMLAEQAGAVGEPAKARTNFDVKLHRGFNGLKMLSSSNPTGISVPRGKKKAVRGWRIGCWG